MTKVKTVTIKPLFDRSQYEVQFESIFQYKDLHDNYHSYLKTSHQQEPLLFLTAVKEFKLLPNEVKAMSILDSFIKEGGKYELNLSNHTKHKLYRTMQSIETSKDCNTLANLFDDTFHLISLELRTDSYNRYLASKFFEELINKKGEDFLKKISTIVSIQPKNKKKSRNFDVAKMSESDIEFLVKVMSKAQ
ncbi:Rgs3 [Acrasis kona]